MRFFLFLIMSLGATRCGVEAGNAGGGKGKTGSVKISFAQQSGTSNESLSVGINSLSLVNASDSDSNGTSITTIVDSIDLFSKTQEDNVVVAESTIIPVGSYTKISIRLKGDKPVRYRDGDGHERDVHLEDSTAAAFYVSQTFTVAEGKTTSIVVSLDPYRSLQSGSDDRFVFKPRGDARAEEREVEYKGTTAISDAIWVCAYAYAIEAGPQFGIGGDRPEFGHEGPSPYHGPRVEDRGSSIAKADIIKDPTDACSNAYTKAPVRDGMFDLRHLIPASYSLRIFSANGSYTDIAEDIILPPKDRH
jgi:hypothetical protein